MVDYARALATAQRLIADAGRLVALQGASSGPADKANPLGGAATAPDPVTGVPAAFLAPTGGGLGSILRPQSIAPDAEQIALVAYDGTNDFKKMVWLTDSNGSKWKILKIDELKPAETPILYYIQVKRP